MKKNKTIRLAAALLVATLLSTSMISGAFAKYTAQASGADSARVAKWGIGYDVPTDLNLFDGSYTNVASKDTTNVIAPGTSKTVTVTLVSNGKEPEVAYKLNFGLSSTGVAETIDANPNIKWTLKLPGASETTKYDTFAALKSAVDAYTVDVSANQLPTNNTFDIGWEWAYETATGDGQPAAQDATDTAMGNASTLASTGTITLTVTATQID